MILKIIVLAFVIVNEVTCQDDTSLAESHASVMNITDDVPAVATLLDTELTSNTQPAQDVDVTVNNESPPVMEEQADQPVETAPMEPTRLPPVNPEVSTFPPLVHIEPTKTEIPTTISIVEVKTTAPTKVGGKPGPNESEKATSTGTKKPETTPDTKEKEGKNGSGFYKENVLLIGFSAWVFYNLN